MRACVQDKTLAGRALDFDPPGLRHYLTTGRSDCTGPGLSGVACKQESKAKFCELSSRGRDSGKAEAARCDTVTSAQPESQLEANLTSSKIF